MPLKSGKGRKTHGANVKELMGTWHRTGKIGNTKPRSSKQAERIANAIAYKKARGG
jgi:hypothetical protein